MQRVSPLKKGQKELLIKSFVQDLTATQAASFADVDRNTANLWFRTLRQIIMEETKNSPRFKGVVEVDQAFFARKRKKKKVKRVRFGLNYGLMGLGHKPGYEKNKAPEDLIQVFGLMKRGKPNIVHTHIVKRGDRKTLVPIIHLVVEGGSTIYSDSHRSFDHVEASDYKHGVINKKLRQVFWKGKLVKRPKKHMHVNTIESFWSFAKERLRKFRGVRRHVYPLHIKEGEFRYNHRQDLEGAVKKLLA